jgi:hypothetical protein
MKFVTIEIQYDKHDKQVVIAGAMVADGPDDAYEQMANDHPNERDEVLCVKAENVPQLIVDMTKMMKKLKF